MNKSILIKIRRGALDFIIFFIPIALFFIVLPHVFRLIIPFIIGLFIYFIAKPLNNLFQRRLPPALSALLSLGITALAFTLLVWLVFSTLIKELYGFAESLSSFYSSTDNSFSDFFGELNSIGRRFSVDFTALPDTRIFSDSIKSAFKDWISRIIAALSKFLINTAKNIPSFVIVTFISFFTAFFMLKDMDALSLSFRKIIGEKAYTLFLKIKNTLFKVLGKYLKAQLAIELVIFGILFLGFSVLQVDYILLFAFITAIVDAVPVLGTGTVLIPWSLFSFISGRATLGWGLISLYGICILARQLCEPKIIGKNLGIHPLVTIASIYIGLKLFGFFGIIIGPVAALFIKSLLSYNFSEA